MHSDIARLFPDKRVAIFFTRRSRNDAMLPLFQAPNIRWYDISAYTGSKWLYPLNLIYRGIVAGYINRQKKAPVVFNGQSNFAYKLSPHLRRDIRQVELIHSFCSFSYIRIPFLPFYSTSVMISRDAICTHLELYRRYRIPAAYAECIQLIMNGIPLPEDTSPLAGDTALLYVGRGTSEKRPQLVARIAAKLGVKAGFLGLAEGDMPAFLHPYCLFYGLQSDPVVIDRIYRQHRVVTITSSREGFPMVIMEGMARGLAVLATDVGDIPYHVQNGLNGGLLDHTRAEEEIVQQAAAQLGDWLAHPAQLQAIARNNIAYAREHFGMEAFARAYRKLLIS